MQNQGIEKRAFFDKENFGYRRWFQAISCQAIDCFSGYSNELARIKQASRCLYGIADGQIEARIRGKFSTLKVNLIFIIFVK